MMNPNDQHKKALQIMRDHRLDEDFIEQEIHNVNNHLVAYFPDGISHDELEGVAQLVFHGIYVEFSCGLSNYDGDASDTDYKKNAEQWVNNVKDHLRWINKDATKHLKYHYSSNLLDKDMLLVYIERDYRNNQEASNLLIIDK